MPRQTATPDSSHRKAVSPPATTLTATVLLRGVNFRGVIVPIGLGALILAFLLYAFWLQEGPSTAQWVLAGAATVLLLAVVVTAWWQTTVLRLRCLQVDALLKENHAILEHQAALQKSELRSRRLFEENLTGNYISTPEGTLVSCNKVFLRLFGFTSTEEATATDMVTLYDSPEQRETFLRRIQEEKKLEQYEVRLRRRDGSPIHVLENAIGEFNEDGKLARIRGYLFDNTRRHLLEEQLRETAKLDAVGRLASSVAHDFNNMLTAIIGYGNMLLREVEPEQPRLRLGLVEIVRAGERSSALVRRLLAFSRNQMVTMQVVDLNAIIRDLERLLRSLLSEAIEIVIKLPPQTLALRGDLSQMESVLLNLAINARDAMPSGGRITITTERLELNTEEAAKRKLMPGAHALLTFSDTGTGMTAEVKARLFEPFFTTKAPGQGTGLGLASAHDIISQMRGHIEVESALSKGTTFRIWLPLDHAQPVPIDHDSQWNATTANRETILLVEDDEAVRDLAQNLLSVQNYRVIACANGPEALIEASKLPEHIDLLLTDIILPQLSGFELAERLLRSRPELKVLYMTGYVDGSDHHILQRLKVDHELIRKPFSAEVLSQKVRSVLKQQASQN
jgi:two-component system, cell cycle sensor histidine kinase and response regulator CckA